MPIRYPFTLQYSLKAIPAETAAMPGFTRANYIITSVWTAASLLMMIGDAAMLYVPACRSGRPRDRLRRANSAVSFTNGIPAPKATYGLAAAGAIPRT